MFRRYGVFGIFLIVFVQFNFFFQIQPFANWYFPLIWIGYILTIDALIYKLKKESLLTKRISEFLGMTLISMLLWGVFEFANLATHNWQYQGMEGFSRTKSLFASLSFATVLPALFETVELIRAFHLFEKKKLHKKHKISKRLLQGMIFFGSFCFILPFVFPRIAYPLVWLSFFFILDPINYLHKQPSIIGHLKDRKLAVLFSLLFAGIILGFLWEFWNYWAVPKWTYAVPYVGFWKIFEMPLLGYLGYFPFALELYAMYWFMRSLFFHKEKALMR